MRRRGVVLLYHRVAVTDVDFWRMSVHPDRFAEHIDLIASTYCACTLTELVAATSTPRLSLAVTFDDGYRDNLHVAKPLLERHGVPASVFVVSGYVDSGVNFWWDVLEQYRSAAALADAELRALHRELQSLPHDERVMLLQRLVDGIDMPSTERTTLTAPELVQLAAGDLVEVGAHTVTHPDLRQLDSGAQLDEMRAGREQLEEWLGRPVRGFAYPYGGVGTAAPGDVGFEYACTSRYGAVGPETDPLLVPRLHVEDWPADELERRITAVLDGE